MILTQLVGKAKKTLVSRRWWKDNSPAKLDDELLLVADARATYGYFTSVTRTTAGTSIITSPSSDGSMMITDLIISSDRKNSSSVTVQFTDGTESVTVFSSDVTDAPANIGLSMAGRWQGWRNARVEVVTVGTVNATVAIGYTKVPFGLAFAEWDANR